MPCGSKGAARQGVVVVAALGEHDGAHDGDEHDRRPLAHEDDERGEADRGVGEDHGEGPAGDGQPHPPDVDAERGEERLGDVGGAGVDPGGEGGVDEQQQPRRDEAVAGADRRTVEAVHRAGRVERPREHDEGIGHEGHGHEPEQVGEGTGASDDAGEDGRTDDDAGRRSLDADRQRHRAHEPQAPTPQRPGGIVRGDGRLDRLVERCPAADRWRARPVLARQCRRRAHARGPFPTARRRQGGPSR